MNFVDRAMAILADKTLVHEHVNADEKSRRLTICESCPFFDQNSRRCKKCKCYMDAKTGSKTNFNPKRGRNEITHCPGGFWGDIDTANLYREKDGLPIISQT